MSFRRLSNFRTFISASRAKRCAWITSRREEALLRISKEALFFARTPLLDESANFERSALFRKNASSRRDVIHAHLLAREALMNVRKFDNLRKDIAYPAMSPIVHLRFWEEHVLHLVLHVHCAHSGIRRAPLASTSDWKSAKSVHAEH